MHQDGVEAAKAVALLAEQDVGPGGDSNEESNEEVKFAQDCEK